MLRVVFDTNILVAGLRSKRGASYTLLALIDSRKFELAVSASLYLEYLDVLTRPAIKPHGVSNGDILGFVREILKFSHQQSIYFRWRPWLPDIKDDMILELAVASQSSHIVTFNLKDFNEIDSFGIEAITPFDFLTLVRNL